MSTHPNLQSPDPQSQSGVTLVEYDPDAEAKTVAAILYPHTDLPLEQVRALAGRLAAEERLAIIRAYVGERGSRFHRPGRAFEEPYYTFDMLADLGAYRDLQRHRILTQDRQRYTVRHGYVTPPELEEAGLARPTSRRSNAPPRRSRRSPPICPSRPSTPCRWRFACAGGSS